MTSTRTAVGPAAMTDRHTVPERLAGRLLATDRSVTALVLRLTLAVVMFPHGAQKMLGWFDGPGFAGEMSILTDAVGLPVVIAFLVIVIEFFGSIGLALGFLTRIAAAGIASVMTGAVLTVHLRFGFFMNWFGNQAGEGFEYHILAIGLSLALLLMGSGAVSLDRVLIRRQVGR